MNSRRRTDLRTALVATLGLAVAAPLVIATAATAPPAADASATQLADTDWSDVLHRAGDKRTTTDVVPARYTIDDAIARSSLRLASTKTADYWVGLDGRGRLCLVVAFPGKNAIAVTTCTDEPSFAAEGLGVQANTIDGAVLAYVVPDAEASAVPPATLTFAVPNLLIGDPFAAARDGVSISGVNGLVGDFQLRQFGAPEPF